MHRRTLVFAALAAFVAVAPVQARDAKMSLHGFSGMAAYYSGRGPGLTAAHKTLPFGTRVRVTDVKTGRSVVVTITDRGPFTPGRVLDLCTKAARELRMIDRGVVYVHAEILQQHKELVAGP